MRPSRRSFPRPVLHLLLLGFLATFLAACSAAGGPTSAPSAQPASPAGETPPAAATVRPGPSGLPAATVPPSALPVTGEVPADVVNAARASLAERIGEAAATSAAIVQAEAVEWPDGSLGCPVAGERYLQQPVRGYHLVLASGGVTYDYRATEGGQVRACGWVPPALP